MSETIMSESSDTCVLPLFKQKLKKMYILSDLPGNLVMTCLALDCKQKLLEPSCQLDPLYIGYTLIDFIHSLKYS